MKFLVVIEKEKVFQEMTHDKIEFVIKPHKNIIQMP